MKYFTDKIQSDRKINLLFANLETQYSIQEKLNLFLREEEIKPANIDELSFENSNEQGLLLYKLLICIKNSVTKLGAVIHTYGKKGEKAYTIDQNFFKKYLEPLLNCINDNIDSNNNILNLLYKYKKRTEWFTSKNLLKEYSEIKNKQYEQLFEDDLRLFLYDNGIEYPFSTPLSKSGRADIVAQPESPDPVIVEIKLIHKQRNYGKERIIEGFSQIEKYTDEYNKDNGYLVIFNLDKTNIEFGFKDQTKGINMLNFNSRYYFFIVVNLSLVTASNIGKLKTLEISETEFKNE